MFYRTLFTTVFASALFISLPADAEVKIGLASDLAGPNASMGTTMRTGAEQAVADINAKGGILGEKVVLSFGDDRSDPKEAVSVSQKLISNNVKFVIGHLTSGATSATIKDYAEAGVLLVTPSATRVDLTEQGLWNVIRTCGRDDIQGQTAGNYIAANFKDKKIAIIHDKAPYGKGLADETRKALHAKDIKEVLYDGINSGEKDFSALVSRMKSLNVDVLYFGGYYGDAGLIIRQMRDQGMKDTLMIGGDGLYNSELGQIAGDGVVGTLFTYNADPQKLPTASAAVAALKAKNIDTSSFMLPTYAAVQVLAEAANDAKTLDPKKISETLRSGKTFDTVLGPLSFDKKGDLTKANFVIYDWKKDASGKLIYSEKTAASQ